MLRKITYNSVNWVDGMKITREHFIQLENNLYDYIRDASALRLNAFNYGILPAHPDSPTGESLKYNLAIDRNGLLKIDVYECRAITPAGTRIEISASSAFTEQKSLSTEVDLKELGSTNFFVVVSSNPFERQPVGQPDPNDNPPRFPFAIPTTNIEIVPVENYNKMTSGPFHVAIAKIKYTNTRAFAQDEEYIPPAATLKSNSDLVDIHGSLDAVLCDIEKFTVEIIKNIYKKQQTNELPQAILYLCEEVMSFTGSNLSYFRWVVAESSPVHMIEFFMRFARLIKNTIDVREGTGKEQMIDYFKDWIVEVNQGEFEEVVKNMMNCQYQHADINQSILLIQRFTKTIRKVFEQLSGLDYIGDRKKTQMITVKDTTITERKRRGFSID